MQNELTNLKKELAELTKLVDGLEAGSTEWEYAFREIENINYTLKNLKF